ncbi:hypothetical protein J1C56_31135 [Aminobacter anthyllidis]|uniref:Uncharacterized protein n=1 Tax=Aminobacter anthyllidis TaxID=1035067 RepID=A0A9X1AI63_9HYPH|nr:hypothetical protein [Aminobacter anthyllidis]MBT1159996.1 hypothetical protein [Aminobacter anthyllidis]
MVAAGNESQLLGFSNDERPAVQRGVRRIARLPVPSCSSAACVLAILTSASISIRMPQVLGGSLVIGPLFAGFSNPVQIVPVDARRQHGGGRDMLLGGQREGVLLALRIYVN